MSYDVYWDAEPYAHVIRLWLRAANPERVMDAYEDVTRILSEAPADWGESRSTLSERVLFHAPFRIAFRINEERHEVDILDVRWIGD